MPVVETAQLVLVQRVSSGKFVQRGHVTGTFDADMQQEATITNRGVEVTFTLQVSGPMAGTVSGTGLAILTLTGKPIAPFTGTGTITGGTGAWAHARSNDLHVIGAAALDGSSATVHLTGTVRGLSS